MSKIYLNFILYKSSTGIYHPISTIKSPVQYTYPDPTSLSELNLPQYSSPIPSNMIQHNNNNRHSTQEYNQTYSNSVDRHMPTHNTVIIMTD